jgi:hypothetical protein
MLESACVSRSVAVSSEPVWEKSEGCQWLNVEGEWGNDNMR